MFPLNDTEPNRYSDLPVMTISLIIVNALIFFLFPIEDGRIYMVIANVPAFIFERIGGSFYHLALAVAFYLFAGFGSDLVFNLVNVGSHTPVIGASGALFGVMGAYLILYPQARIRTLIFGFGFVPLWPRLRAIWVILYFLGLQVVPALDILLNDAGGSYDIAYWGHLGGFFASLGILLFLRPEAFARYLSDTHV